MNSGKSTALMQVAYNYEERGMRVLIMKPSIDTKGGEKLMSRLGVERRVDIAVRPDMDPLALVRADIAKNGPLACVLTDESQFFTSWQAEQLFMVTVALNVPVICYGLRADFSLQGFPGSTRLLVGALPCTFAQVGAVGAIWAKTKNKKTRSLCPPAFISGLVGITEPAIYGLTLPTKKPFVITCITSGIAGAVLMALGVTQYQLAGMGIFQYTAYVPVGVNDLSGMIASIIVTALTVVATFAIVFVTYKDPETK